VNGYTQRLEVILESEIAHDRRHDPASKQIACFQPPCNDPQEDISVEGTTLSVHTEHPVGVTVKGDPQMIAPRFDPLRKAPQMHDARVFVDIHAVGLSTYEVRLVPEFRKKRRCRGSGGSIGTIHENLPIAVPPSVADCVRKPPDIDFPGCGIALDVVMEDPGLWTVIGEVERSLGDSGRVLVRPSGTEPMIRVLVQTKDPAALERSAVRIVEAIVQAGHN